MASAQERFDSQKIRDEIFETRSRNILITIMFVAETAIILKEKGRTSDFVFIADRSIEILQGNLILTKVLLSEVLLLSRRDINTQPLELLNYYLVFEKLLDDSIHDKKMRMVLLVELGKAYNNYAHYKHAIECTLTAENIAHKLKINLYEAVCCTILANSYYCLGEYQKSIDYQKRGLKIHTKTGNRLGIADCISNLGNVYLRLGKYQKVIDYCEISIQIHTEIGDRLGIANDNVLLANVYCGLGEFKKAIDYQKRGLKIHTEIGDRLGIANGNANLGNTYRRLAEYQKGIEYQKRGLQIHTEIGHRSGIASDNANLGITSFSLGEIEKAIDYHKISLQIHTGIGDRSGIASDNGSLGTAYSSLGEYKRAIDYHEKSLEISIEIGDRSRIASENRFLGSAYFSLGDCQKAIYYYEIGLQISTEIGDQSGIANGIGNLGSVYCRLGEYQKAIDYHKRSLQIQTEIGDRSGIASEFENLGKAYCGSGEYKKAMILYQNCLRISSEIGEKSLIATSNGNLGFCCLVQGYLNVDNEEAVSIIQQAAGYLEESVKYSDEIFAGLVVDENKISFTKQFYYSYKLLMFCFILLKRIEAALLIIDLGKAKALHAFLEKQNKSGSDIMPDYTRKTWKRIHNNKENTHTKEIENILELKTNNSTVLFFSFDICEALIIWVLNGEDNTKLYIRKESIEMSSPDEYIYDNLKKLLKLFSVDLKRNSSFNKLDLDSISSEQMIMHTQLVKKLVSCEINRKFQRTPCPKNQSGDNTPETPENILRNLYRVIIEPVKDWIKGNKLVIVPDKFLFFLPFCALLDENGCRLSENYCLEITPSLHTLVSSITRPRDSSLGFALFVGNPTVGKINFSGKNIQPSELPSATEEVKCLAALFEAQPLVEGEATKDRVLGFLNGASIIHIAAHGESERGEIFLSTSCDDTEKSSDLPKVDSYLLKQQDIMKIGINASLVVLSCCHTGKGKISSEGVVGLTRAFLAAGARSVLATLWPIHDEGTKEFMKIFYEKICNEISVCEALRTTMNMFHRHENEEFRLLQIWAPFTIYGEDVRFTNGDIEEIKGKSRQFNEKIKSI